MTPSYFVIQASEPRVLPSHGPTGTLAEALSLIFPDRTEEAYLIWNWIPVRINYKYDLSVMIDDVPDLLGKLLRETVGSHRVYWGSNSFLAEWKLAWSGGSLSVEADWKSVAGDYADLLNSRSRLEIGHQEFVWEWKALLNRVIKSVEASGIEIVNQSQLRIIREIEAKIPQFGRLYQSP